MSPIWLESLSSPYVLQVSNYLCIALSCTLLAQSLNMPRLHINLLFFSLVCLSKKKKKKKTQIGYPSELIIITEGPPLVTICVCVFNFHFTTRRRETWEKEQQQNVVLYY